jgi:hypothetical protein
LAIDEAQARDWTQRATALAARQGGRAFSEARDTLASKGEIHRLLARWNHSPQPAITPRRRAAKLAAWAIGVMLATVSASTTRAGDGRDFKTAQSQQPAPVTPAPALTPIHARPALVAPSIDADPRPVFTPRAHNVPSLSRAARSIPTDADVPHFVFRNVSVAADLADTSWTIQDTWGDRIRAIAQAAPRQIASPPPPAPATPPPALRERPETPAVPKAVAEQPTPPPHVPLSMAPADRADRALSMARNYLAAEKLDTAREKLQELVKAYPDTPAATEAERLLHQVASN